MSCPRSDRMDLYLEGELAGAERREFEAHLASCPACRQALEDLKAFDRAFSSLPPVEVPEDFAAAVLARLPAVRRPAFGRLATLVAGAAVLLSGLLGYYLLTGEGLFGIILSVGRTLMGYLGLAVPFFAKVFKLGIVLFNLVGSLGTAAVKGLFVLPSLLRPEFAGGALILGLLVSVLVVLGVKKFVLPGEKS